MAGIKVLFLDRDGVVNEDRGYVHDIGNFAFRARIFDICRRFRERGFEIIIVTNQSGISRGIFSEGDYSAVTAYMLSEFRNAGIDVLDVLHCPDSDDGSYMRKPNPGMFEEAARRHGIDMRASINVGDRERDLEAGRRAGVGSNVYIDTLEEIL